MRQAVPVRRLCLLGNGLGAKWGHLRVLDRSVKEHLDVLFKATWCTDYPLQAQWTIEIQPLQETLVGKVRPMLLVLLGAGRPDRFHRIVEHCQSPLGARFGA